MHELSMEYKFLSLYTMSKGVADKAWMGQVLGGICLVRDLFLTNGVEHILTLRALEPLLGVL